MGPKKADHLLTKLKHSIVGRYVACVYTLTHVCTLLPLLLSHHLSSQVYAPMTRTGVFLDAASEHNAVHSHLTSTLDGLLALEASLPSFITQPR